jgi:DNA polymerase III subunit gamma/tau
VSSTAPHRALYLRWRAQTFSQIVGQEATIETLRNAVRTGRLAHALLFVGPRGTGKTSTARIVAKAVNCLDLRDGEPCDACEPCVAIREGRALDVVEMDAASNNKVDDMREFLPRVWTAPSDLGHKVFIIDEVQRIKEGWDVLLKTLEEPPDHVLFIFCTTDAGGIRPAVVSRVQRFDFRRLPEDRIAGKLRMILEADGLEADAEAVEVLARLADGGMRDAESMLDQLLSGGDGRLTADRVRDLLGLADDETVERFAAALVDGEALAGIAALDALDDRGRDLRAFIEQVVDALRRAIVAALGPAAGRTAVPLADRAPAALAVGARRIVDLDPSRLGQGGLRFALELALLGGPAAGAAAHLPSPGASPAASGRPPARPASSTVPAADRAGADAGDRATPAPRADRERPAGRAAERPASGSSSAVPPPGGPAADGPGGSTEPVTLEEVRAAWPDVVRLVSHDPPTKPLIEACAPVALDDGVLSLGFPESRAFLRERAEKKRSVIEEGLRSALGRRVAVRCIATNVVPEPLPAGDDAERLLAEARRIFADDIADVPDVR